MGLVAFSPMANGFLTGQYGKGQHFDPPPTTVPPCRSLPMKRWIRTLPLLKLLNDMAAEKHATPAQISLAWMLCKRPWIVPIPGTRKEARMKENAGAADVALSSGEVKALDDALNTMEMSAVFGGTPAGKGGTDK